MSPSKQNLLGTQFHLDTVNVLFDEKRFDWKWYLQESHSLQLDNSENVWIPNIAHLLATFRYKTLVYLIIAVHVKSSSPLFPFEIRRKSFLSDSLQLIITRVKRYCKQNIEESFSLIFQWLKDGKRDIFRILWKSEKIVAIILLKW